MSLTIVTPSVPDFFEGVPIPALQFVASGTIPGDVYRWSVSPRDEQGVERPLPQGLTLSNTGLLAGTPADISDDGGTARASGVSGAFSVSITSVTVPPIFGSSQLEIEGNRYPVSRVVPAGINLYTVEITTRLATSFTDQPYKVIPVGGAKAFPVIIKIARIVTVGLEEQEAEVSLKEFRIIVLKLNNTETLFKYLDQATDADGRLLDSTYKTIMSTLSLGEQQALTSLVAGGQAIVNQQTGQLEKFLVLPAFAIEV